MAKAVVDPAELRRFAQDLKRFNSNLMNQLAALQGRLNDLGQTWRDQEQVKFVEEFESTMKALGRFTDAAERHVPFLLRKAEKIEEYLNQR
jgi:WXG100 family type VII secretion target